MLPLIYRSDLVVRCNVGQGRDGRSSCQIQAQQPQSQKIEPAAEDAIKAEAQQHPLMQAAMASFPNAKIIDIRTAAEITADAELDALPEVEDEWDPFEES